MRPSFERGVIEEVVDNRLQNEYNVSSVWKVVDTAMACVKYEGKQQPTMNEVCKDLEEAMAFETTDSHIILTTSTEVYPLTT